MREAMEEKKKFKIFLFIWFKKNLLWTSLKYNSYQYLVNEHVLSSTFIWKQIYRLYSFVVSVEILGSEQIDLIQKNFENYISKFDVKKRSRYTIKDHMYKDIMNMLNEVIKNVSSEFKLQIWCRYLLKHLMASLIRMKSRE
jgi:hypothetical protein